QQARRGLPGARRQVALHEAMRRATDLGSGGLEPLGRQADHQFADVLAAPGLAAEQHTTLSRSGHALGTAAAVRPTESERQVAVTHLTLPVEKQHERQARPDDVLGDEVLQLLVIRPVQRQPVAQLQPAHPTVEQAIVVGPRQAQTRLAGDGQLVAADEVIRLLHSAYPPVMADRKANVGSRKGSAHGVVADYAPLHLDANHYHYCDNGDSRQPAPPPATGAAAWTEPPAPSFPIVPGTGCSSACWRPSR